MQPRDDKNKKRHCEDDDRNPWQSSKASTNINMIIVMDHHSRD